MTLWNLVNPGYGPIALNADVGSPLWGDAWVDFKTMADGAPGPAATGETTLRDSGGSIVQATVSGGALVAPDSGNSTTASYPGWRLREDIKSIYADWSWGDANDVLALVAAADVTQVAIVDSSCHIIFAANGATIQRFTDSTVTSEETVGYSVNYGQRYRIGWRIDGNDIYLLLPNGTESGPHTYSEVATRTNHCVIFEHYRTTTGAPTGKLYAVAANLFASPTAAGRTQLLTNTTNLGNAAWTKNRLTTEAGIADRLGGTTATRILETAASGIHNARQSVAKATSAKRYTFRYEIKPIGRDWVKMWAFDDVGSDQAYRYLKLSDGTFGTQAGSFTDKTWMVYPLGDGWYQVQGDFTSDAANAITPSISLASADNTESYLGEITKGADIANPWLFERPT